MESSAPFSSSSSSVQDSNFEFKVLPADLITEILLRLPVKPFLKFKCVSKFWLGLISSPRFVKRHLNISTNNKAYHRVMLGFNPSRKNLKGCSVSSLLKYPFTMAIDLDFPPKKSYQSIKVVGFINGLICLAIAEISYQYIKDLFLWNPSVRKLKKLPSSTTGSFYMYSFGYDELQDDYKVVEITKTVYDTDSHYNVGKIYSLNNNSWTRLNDLKIENKFNDSGVLVNGKLHWAITKKNFGYYNNWFILVVDLANGRWEEMEYTYYGEGISSFPWYLGMLGNDFSMSYYPVMTHVDVWVMKEYGVKESWTKTFIIKYPNDLMEYRLFGPTFSSEGEILFNSGPIFMIYNPNEDSMRFSDVTNCGHVVVTKATLYVESLVWPFVAEGTRDATTSKAAKALKCRTVISTQLSGSESRCLEQQIYSLLAARVAMQKDGLSLFLLSL